MNQLLDNDISMMRALSALSPSNATEMKTRIRESEAVLAKLEAANEPERERGPDMGDEDGDDVPPDV